MRIILFILLISLTASAQPKIIDSNWHYRDKAGNVVDTTTYFIYEGGGRDYRYLNVITQTNYRVRYKMVIGRGSLVYVDCCASITPDGQASYIGLAGQWVYPSTNNNISIYRYTELRDIDSADIYENDMLKDRTGQLHKVWYWNGAFRYGKATIKKQLDSILCRQVIIKDSLYIKR